MTKKETRSRGTAKKPDRFRPTEHRRNYAQIAWRYASKAIRDRNNESHCHFVRRAAIRFVRDLRRQMSEEFDYYFDPWHANDICDFVEKLPHVEGQWDSREIELHESQIFILANIFGWRRKSDQKRRFSMVYIEMARKGAKSTLTAAVALYCLTCEDELGPQIVVGATTSDQAQKVFMPAKRMAEYTPALIEQFGLEVWARSIVCRQNGGFIQPINSNASTQDGWNPHVGILDELHAHKTRNLFDVIKSAFGARKNPLMWVITTAGYDTQGVCYEQRKLVAKILDGIIEADHYFGIIFTIDEGDSEYDETKWIKANPLIGITPTWQSMRDYAEEAKAAPGVAYEFKTKRCNIWSTSKGGWLNMELWRACDVTIDLDQMTGPCYGGLDLASVSDVTAFVLIWEIDGRIKVYPRFYLPEEMILAHIKRRSVPYDVWVRAGHIIVTPGSVTDYNYIERDIRESMDRWDVKMIGFDPWNSTQVVSNLLEEGAPMVEMRQGAKTFNQPMKELERLLLSGEIETGGNPVMSWMASNIVCRHDANDNIAPDKKHSEEKIDGIVALLMALAAKTNDDEGSIDEFLTDPVII